MFLQNMLLHVPSNIGHVYTFAEGRSVLGKDHPTMRTQEIMLTNHLLFCLHFSITASIVQVLFNKAVKDMAQGH